MTKQKLKPCPFCGGKADVDSYYSNNGFFDNPTKIYKVFCQDCPAKKLCEKQLCKKQTCKKQIEMWLKQPYEVGE